MIKRYFLFLPAIILLFFTSCQDGEKSDELKGFGGWDDRVKSVKSTTYAAIEDYNGNISAGEVYIESYISWNENGVQTDEGYQRFYVLVNNDEYEKQTESHFKKDYHGNWTESITYDGEGRPYSITKIEIQYYD